MSEIPFHQTRMGQIFYEGTMPRLVRELARLNDNLERLAQQANRPPAAGEGGGGLVERANPPSGAGETAKPLAKEAAKE